MKKSLLSVLAALSLSFGAMDAYAGPDDKSKKKVKDKKELNGAHGGKDKPRAVPEIDATSGTLALAFLGGVLLLGSERLRRRAPSQN